MKLAIWILVLATVMTTVVSRSPTRPDPDDEEYGPPSGDMWPESRNGDDDEYGLPLGPFWPGQIDDDIEETLRPEPRGGDNEESEPQYGPPSGDLWPLDGDKEEFEGPMPWDGVDEKTYGQRSGWRVRPLS